MADYDFGGYRGSDLSRSGLNTFGSDRTPACSSGSTGIDDCYSSS